MKLHYCYKHPNGIERKNENDVKPCTTLEFIPELYQNYVSKSMTS